MRGPRLRNLKWIGTEQPRCRRAQVKRAAPCADHDRAALCPGKREARQGERRGGIHPENCSERLSVRAHRLDFPTDDARHDFSSGINSSESRNSSPYFCFSCFILRVECQWAQYAFLCLLWPIQRNAMYYVLLKCLLGLELNIFCNGVPRSKFDVSAAQCRSHAPSKWTHFQVRRSTEMSTLSFL